MGEVRGKGLSSCVLFRSSSANFFSPILGGLLFRSWKLIFLAVLA